VLTMCYCWYPIDKSYTPEHEWVSFDSDTVSQEYHLRPKAPHCGLVRGAPTDAHLLCQSQKIGTIGITEYAQKALGDVVFVELPNAGTEVAKHGDLSAPFGLMFILELMSYNCITQTKLEQSKVSKVSQNPVQLH